MCVCVCVCVCKSVQVTEECSVFRLYKLCVHVCGCQMSYVYSLLMRANKLAANVQGSLASLTPP